MERRLGDGIVPLRQLGLKGVNPFDPAFPQHLCSSQWHRTCRGISKLCQNAPRSDVISINPGAAWAVDRFNQAFLWHIGQRCI
mgnify:CR=1 FL=1